jgi:predicted RNA-binding Zn-ribbon protein involved in translation (DUF1610 family)
MFENLLKTLHTLSEQKAISIPLAADSKGYLDKECPSEDCLFHFKVNADDWTKLDQGAVVTCPMCGHKAPAMSWYTTDQVEEAKAQAIASLQGTINKAMCDDAQAFNSRQPRNSFIKMSMSVKGNSTSYSSIIVPIEAAEAMELEIRCEQCETRFAVIGSAFFCPTCGHSSAERMFDDALRKMEVKMSSTEVVREAIKRVSGKDAAAVAAKSMLESCLPDGVVAFQKLAEALYSKLPNVRPASFNAFQRLRDGSELWKDAVGYGYEDWLLPEELSRISILFQRRHLLAHSEGMVDAKYLSNTNDPDYVERQRIIVAEQDVEDLRRILAKLARAIREAMPM